MSEIISLTDIVFVRFYSIKITFMGIYSRGSLNPEPIKLQDSIHLDRSRGEKIITFTVSTLGILLLILSLLIVPRSKIDRSSKITICFKLENKQQHSKILLNSFLMNDQT